MGEMSNFRVQDKHESSHPGLRFEAYELPKAPPIKATPVSLASPTDLVPVPETLYSRETHQIPSAATASEAGSSGLKLRLDGVQRKWGRPTYSSATSSNTSDSSSQKAVNGVTQVNGTSVANSKVRDSYDSRKAPVEISPEKQKLAGLLFGGTSKPEKRQPASHKIPKANTNAADRSQESRSATVPNEVAMEKANNQPPPDLLDLGEPTVTAAPPSVDPFMQLEGLIGPSPSSTIDHSQGTATKAPDIMGLYAETTTGGQSVSGGFSMPVSGEVNLLSELSNAAVRGAPGETTVTASSQPVKGPNAKDSLEKDSRVRQLGVNPSSQNPNLFRDLLG